MIEIIVIRKHIYEKKNTDIEEPNRLNTRSRFEVNMVRLKEKARELLAKGTSSTKYIMFIDFKQAYDSIKHMMFFENLEKMGTPESVVNTMKKLLS